jgi:ubiquinone/menaquinone biosynthesis C-methylase UbiE
VAHWDDLASRFDDIFLADPAYRETLERMVGLVEKGEDARIMDLGCGTGNLIALLLDRFPRARVVGVDPSPGMRERCEQRFGSLPNVEIREGDGLVIPYPDADFDCVLSSLALHHIPPDLKKDNAAEIARVLAPGGSLIHADVFSGVPGPPDDPERARDIIQRIVAKALYSLDHGAYRLMIGELSALPRILKEDGEYLLTVEEWSDILRGAGFTGFQVIDIPPVDLTKIVYCIFKG